MGVLGLTPFLQKACPEVIKELPTRLRALAGKTIAIDGNLLTQRLHFGAIPHEYRHLVGWHKIVDDLRANGVGAICVWDGKERGSAKAREVARRQALRLLSFARGSHELGRLRRLQRLTTTMKKYQELPQAERFQVSRAMRVAAGAAAEAELHDLAEAMEKVQLSEAVDVSPKEPAADMDERENLYEPVPTPGTADVVSADEPPVRLALLQHLYPPEEREAMSSFLSNIDPSDVTLVSTIDRPSEATLEAIADSDNIQDPGFDYYVPDDLPSSEAYPYPDALSITADLQAHKPEIVADLELDTSAEVEERTVGQTEFDLPAALPVEPMAPEEPVDPSQAISSTSVVHPIAPASQEAEAVAEELASLYRDFQENSSANTVEVAEDGALPVSKFQVQLTEDEKHFWNRLTAETAEESYDAQQVVPTASVEYLLTRSGSISSSYEKRNRLPTNATYAECKRLLIAMGIPCIEAEYPYEAEALAASLVLHGHADFVGSEDTDVLVYGAPLLRNLTSRNTPLALISGADVRNALQLDRESYVDFAILLGTDFTKRVKNLGPHTAIKLIRAHGSIEKALQGQTKYVLETPALYFEQVEVARLVFKTLPPVPDPKLLQPKESDAAEVLALLKEYNIHPADLTTDYDSQPSLEGNYYADDPATTAWH